MRQELRHRGIHDNDIEDAMQEFEDFDEQQAVQQLLEKKFAAALTEEKGRRRAFQALLRLGYDAGTVKSQMQRAMEQLEPEEEPEQPSDPEEEIRALLLKKYRKNLEDPKGDRTCHPCADAPRLCLWRHPVGAQAAGGRGIKK